MAKRVLYDGKAIADDRIERIGCDSFLVRDGLQEMFPNKNAKVIAVLVYREGAWMDREDRSTRTRGRVAPRSLKVVYVPRKVREGDADVDAIPKYSYPAFTYKAMESYIPADDNKTPTIKRMIENMNKFSVLDEETGQVQRMTKKDGESLEQAIITEYRNGNDSIGPHNDKTHDIAEGSYIVSCSLGVARKMNFYNNDKASTQPLHKIVLQAGDVFLLGPETNRVMRHGIPKVAKRRAAAVGSRISIIARALKTAMTHRQLAERVAKSALGKGQ